MIPALVVGDKQGISQHQWQVLRRTGTNHLMAIAGLHIGFMAGLVYFIVNFVVRWFPRIILLIPAQQVALVAAMVCAFIYSSLAGFQVPTIRACVMIATFMVAKLLRRHFISITGYCSALLIVLVLNPFSIFDPGFWLSFAAVGVILYGMLGRVHPDGLWWKWGRTQWVITIGLIPFSLLFFAQTSLIAPLANVVAIPCVGMMTVPLSLLGALLLLLKCSLAKPILILAAESLHLIFIYLNTLASISYVTWNHPVFNSINLIFLVIATLLLISPRGFPGRILGFVFLLPIFFYPAKILKKGEVKLTLLDVGQGLSAVVQTRHHVLVFDAGAKYLSGFNMGDAVIIPFLQDNRLRQINKMVISHGDNDHIGGAFALVKHFHVLSIDTSVPNRFAAHSAHFCLQGMSWSWDGVKFKFLYPPKSLLGLDNNSSCVLHITTGNQGILLTGDIEKLAENYLVSHEKKQLAASILVAAHHGSKTSSTLAFIKAVRPKIVLFPVGYLNRYHFPNQIIIKRYHALHVKEFDTVHDGAIEVLLTPHKIKKIVLSRKALHHFWNDN